MIKYDHTNYILRYWSQIKSGKIRVSRKVRKVYEQLAIGCKSKVSKYHFDIDRASRPIFFVESFCKQSKGVIGQPLKLQLFQKAAIQAIFGFVDANGYRKYREVLWIMGRKNGKSAILSALGLYMMIGDHEGGAEIDCVASKKDQAKIVFTESKNMVSQSPYLSKYIRKRKSDMYSDFNFGVFQPLSSDSNTLDGLNPHCGVIDELHSIKDRNIYDVVKQAMYARKQPILFMITTSGFNREGIYDSQYEYAEQVINGDIKDEHFLPLIYELDEQAEWTDPKMWIKANPGLGVTLQLEELVKQWERAKAIPSERADFICKQLNIMVNADDMAFVQPEVIRRNRDTVPEESLLGRRCFGGFDLSNREDFTAAALEFPLDDGRVFVKLHSWVPQRKVDLDQEKLDWYGLQMKGHLTIVPGEYVQQEDVHAWFCEQAKKYEIVTIGYDPANATRLRQMLEVGGTDYPAFDCQVVRQGPITLNDPMKDIKEMLLAGQVVSNADPMLAWYTDNVRISGERRHLDKENWMPTKRNKFRKIDGFMAWLDAHCIKMQKAPAGIDYTPPGIRVVELGGRRR